MVAWLISILRNQHYTAYRKQVREVEDIDGTYADTLVSPPDQIARVGCEELRAALAALPKQMLEALILVTLGGDVLQGSFRFIQLRFRAIEPTQGRLGTHYHAGQWLFHLVSTGGGNRISGHEQRLALAMLREQGAEQLRVEGRYFVEQNKQNDTAGYESKHPADEAGRDYHPVQNQGRTRNMSLADGGQRCRLQ
jgi:hypothetical protein